MRRTLGFLLLLAVLSLLAGLSACRGSGTASSAHPAPDASRPDWALAIHGGAGVVSRSVNDQNRQAYRDTLRKALDLGRSVLAAGGTSLDAVETVVLFLEDDPKFNAGKGAVYNHEGGHELDAAIMDGATLRCGAVASVTTARNPIRLARLVMERTRHILLAGPGADRFAEEMGVPRVGQDYYHTERRRRQWLKKLEQAGDVGPGGEGSGPGERGTVGAVALDRHGDLAAATSTGGLTDKKFGRIGDTPLVGAGTYARNETCAVSGTGVGEEFMRHNVAHRVSTLMEDRGLSLRQAAEQVIMRTLSAGDGGLIAVDRDGRLALVFNSEGMFRGAADSSGRFGVAIWDEEMR